MKYCLPILFITFIFTELSAQSDSVSSSYTSFRKGRNFVGLSGSIGSFSNSDDQGIFIDNNFINKYSFNIRLGKTVADKNLVGLVFNATRDHSTDFVNVEKELLALGPLYRLYLGKTTNIGLYLQTSVVYTYYVQQSEGFQGLMLIDQELSGHGIGGTLGIGFAYVIADIVAFEVGFDYLLTSFNGEFINKITGIRKDLTFQRNGYQFSFGFNLMFGKLKKDE